MIFGLLYFYVVILCVNRLRSSSILYRIVKRHSRQSNVRRISTCADNGISAVSALRPTYRPLGFLRRTLFSCPQDVKEAALIQGYGAPDSGVWKLDVGSSL